MHIEAATLTPTGRRLDTHGNRTMSVAAATHPFEGSEIAAFMARRIEELSGTKTQREIAAQMGYDKPNVVSMMKRGETRVPLDKIPALAAALEVDVRYVYRLAMMQYWSHQLSALDAVLGNTVTDNELRAVEALRPAMPDDKPLSAERLALVAQLLRATETRDGMAAAREALAALAG